MTGLCVCVLHQELLEAKNQDIFISVGSEKTVTEGMNDWSFCPGRTIERPEFWSRPGHGLPLFSWKSHTAFKHLSFPICQSTGVDELASKSFLWLLILHLPFPTPTASLRDPIIVIQLPCTFLSPTLISPPPSRSRRFSCQNLSRICLPLPHFPLPPWCQPPSSLAWRLAVALTCQPPPATAHSAIRVIFSKHTLSHVSALTNPSHAFSGPPGCGPETFWKGMAGPLHRSMPLPELSVASAAWTFFL